MKKVLIVVGSKNDIEYLDEANTLFEKENIISETKIISAHRDIKSLVDNLKPNDLEKGGVGVVLAIAHSVANLPAIIAGYLKDTNITVIGVGVTKTDIDSLSSILSVLSIPTGIPLLNAGINKKGLHNAALSCIKIIKTGGSK